ncbi:hypothetical protein BDV95DRAFT_299149 [Massariosphaeria phaeospora]|uniref:Uncharacterized protein n=1 Tax=Massariosphaeria phaeospora TaxID=100035 RepID=A0A7C8M9T6_9PLEO|nr:hypothetical protein BDV95DRAFT_299149 [Massariosphaeria phaeospora]
MDSNTSFAGFEFVGLPDSPQFVPRRFSDDFEIIPPYQSSSVLNSSTAISVRLQNPPPLHAYQTESSLNNQSLPSCDRLLPWGHPSKLYGCYLYWLPYELRLRICELVLDVNIPRKVFINHSKDWKMKHLSQGAMNQHAAEIVRSELKKENVGDELKKERVKFTLRENTREEIMAYNRALWPALLSVSRDMRAIATEVFYQCTPFVAPGDPYTIPAWEARLPRAALQNLAKNPNLTMEHICNETQHWRCLRGYLYNPNRQPYQIFDPDTVKEYWGDQECDWRRTLPSIAWRFTQLYTIEQRYGGCSTLVINSPLHDPDLSLEECFHSEILQEYQRVLDLDLDDRPHPQRRNAEMRYLAKSVKKFLDMLFEYDHDLPPGFEELRHWLTPWLADPFHVALRPMHNRRYPGGLFFGVHLWEQDIQDFWTDVGRNAKDAMR